MNTHKKDNKPQLVLPATSATEITHPTTKGTKQEQHIREKTPRSTDFGNAATTEQQCDDRRTRRAGEDNT